MGERRKEWAILVAQHVVGKSKFPRGLGFKRYKPFPYSDSNKPHRIVYARVFVGTEEEAHRFGKVVEDKMLVTYVMSLGNTKTYCVTDYTMVLHDITSNTTMQLACSLSGNDCRDPSHLYENVKCSNRLLSLWNIIEGF